MLERYLLSTLEDASKSVDSARNQGLIDEERTSSAARAHLAIATSAVVPCISSTGWLSGNIAYNESKM